MSKEYLEALNELWNIARNDEFGYNGRTEKQCNEFNNKLLELKNIIEKALQRLEAIENVKPSEAMGCLESMSNEKALFRSILSRSTVYMGREQIDDFSYKSTIGNEFKGAISIIKQALIKAQEQEKVLEIIKEKGLPLIERDMIKQSKDYDEYNIKYSWCNLKNASIQKTEEEFDLLKKWLG